jgi:twitching motility protein PilT
VARIDRFFDELLSQKGSDLHLGIGYPPMIRARGELRSIRDEPIDAMEMQAVLFEILSASEHRKITKELDLDFAYAYGDKARFRANYFHKTTGLGAVFRTIPTRILSLDELGCPDAVRSIAERRNGLVLVTGPTGSGKSTTLAAMIHHINQTKSCHILTIEDPVEFVHAPIQSQVTHREVGPDASSFATAIRSAGRENADVILIGELRNNETMKLALSLASFGVLVFGTVHTNSAPATIDRIVNAFAADEQSQVRGMLAESLVAVVAQQLLRTADGQGRVAAHEILLGSSALATLIREGKTFQIPSLMQSGQAAGMQTMDMALERLVRKGTITAEAAMEKAVDKDAFARVVGASPSGGDAAPGSPS